MNGGEEVSFGFVVSGGDGAVELQPSEEILDQMPGFEQFAIEWARGSAICLGRNDGRLAGRGHRFENATVGVVGFVGDERIGLHLWQEFVGAGEIMLLAAG